MKQRILEGDALNGLSPSFVEFVNSIDRENIGIENKKFYIKKVKIDILNEHKELLDFLSELKLGEYNSRNGYRTYENIRVDKKITKKKKSTEKITHVHNDLSEDKLNMIVNDDCLEYMKSLPHNCIDCRKPLFIHGWINRGILYYYLTPI